MTEEQVARETAALLDPRHRSKYVALVCPGCGDGTTVPSPFPDELLVLTCLCGDRFAATMIDGRVTVQIVESQGTNARKVAAILAAKGGQL